MNFLYLCGTLGQQNSFLFVVRESSGALSGAEDENRDEQADGDKDNLKRHRVVLPQTRDDRAVDAACAQRGAA
jgi:hypothetical protein